MNDSIESLISDFRARLRSGKTLPILHKPFSAPVSQPVSGPATVKTMTGAEADLAQCFLVDMANRCVENVKALGKTATKQLIKQAFSEAVGLHAGAIVGNLREYLNLKEKRKNQDAKLAIEREKARKKLSVELKAARKRLRDLRWTIANAETEAARRVEEHAKAARAVWAGRLRSARAKLHGLRVAFDRHSMKIADPESLPTHDGTYPAVPPPTLTPHREGLGLPGAAGIYFIWDDDKIVYVGQSIRLDNRLRLGGHHILKEGHNISYVLVDAKELTFAECYYIGTLRPLENFGATASHRRHATPHCTVTAPG